MKINEVTNYPVKVTLNKKNPWGVSIKVNNLLITTTEAYVIHNEQELKKLKPIEKYVILETIGDIAPLPKNKSKTKDKSKKIDSIIDAEPIEDAEIINNKE